MVMVLHPISTVAPLQPPRPWGGRPHYAGIGYGSWRHRDLAQTEDLFRLAGWQIIYKTFASEPHNIFVPTKSVEPA